MAGRPGAEPLAPAMDRKPAGHRRPRQCLSSGHGCSGHLHILSGGVPHWGERNWWSRRSSLRAARRVRSPGAYGVSRAPGDTLVQRWPYRRNATAGRLAVQPKARSRSATNSALILAEPLALSRDVELEPHLEVGQLRSRSLAEQVDRPRIAAHLHARDHRQRDGDGFIAWWAPAQVGPAQEQWSHFRERPGRWRAIRRVEPVDAVCWSWERGCARLAQQPSR